MTTRLRRTVATLALGLSLPLLVMGVSFGMTMTQPLIAGPIAAGDFSSDRQIERFLLPAGEYLRQDEGFRLGEEWSVYTSATFCGPRLLLGVRDGDGWLLSDGRALARFEADPRIVPLDRPARALTLHVALYTDPGNADPVSIAAARASITEFLPLYASLYTGGALTIEIEDAGEMRPGETDYVANGVSFSGPDLLELRRDAGDDRIGLLLTPARRHDPVRGLAYFDPLDARPGTYTTYTSWFRKAELWRAATGRSLDATLSLDDLSGRELLELLTHTPEEINDPAAIAWHELLHVLELRADLTADVHDWRDFGHNGVQELWFGEEGRAVERSWYGLVSSDLLGLPLLERGTLEPHCLEPLGTDPHPPGLE